MNLTFKYKKHCKCINLILKDILVYMHYIIFYILLLFFFLVFNLSSHEIALKLYLTVYDL